MTMTMTSEAHAMIQDVVRAMLQQEKTTYMNFCCRPHVAVRKVPMLPSRSSLSCDPWRSLMISWFWTVVDCFKLAPDNVAAAVYFLDQCDSSKGFVASPTDYQLLSVTALQLAVKLHSFEVFPLDQLVKFLSNGVGEEEIQQMERRILSSLQWRLHPPTPYAFIGYFLQLLPENAPASMHGQLNDIAHKTLRLAVADLFYVQFPPSIIAYSVLLHAMEELGDDLGIEEKQIFAWRLQDTAYLTSQSPGLVTAYTALRSLLIQASGSSAIFPPNPDTAETNVEMTVNESPSSILKHCFIHIPTTGKDGYDGIEVIPDFSCYGEDNYLGLQAEGSTTMSPRNVVHEAYNCKHLSVR
jgi:hypothetical protein